MLQQGTEYERSSPRNPLFGQPSLWPTITLANPHFGQPSLWPTLILANPHFGQPSLWPTLNSAPSHSPTLTLANFHCGQPSLCPTPTFANFASANPHKCGNPSHVWPSLHGALVRSITFRALLTSSKPNVTCANMRKLIRFHRRLQQEHVSINFGVVPH